MTIFQTEEIKWGPKAFNPRHAGDVVENLYTFTVSAAFTTADDLIEMCVQPARTRLVRCAFACESLGAGNIRFGYMTGNIGDTAGTRTLGNELFAAQDNTAPDSLSLIELAALSVDEDDHRAIGAHFSANLAGSVDDKIHLLVAYKYI